MPDLEEEQQQLESGAGDKSHCAVGLQSWRVPLLPAI